MLIKSVTGGVDTTALQVFEVSRGGIRIHARIVRFADRSRSDALPHSDGCRAYLLNIVRDVLERLGVDGIHLDYVRYGGGASDRWHYVSSFVRDVRRVIDEVKPGTILSIASKAEDYGSRDGLRMRALYYGQNYEDLAQYVDVFMPMTYYLDYNVDPVRAVAAARWVKEITGRPVVMGLQLHPASTPRRGIAFQGWRRSRCRS